MSLAPNIELVEISSIREFLALSALRVQPEQRRYTTNILLSWMQSRHPAVTTYKVIAGGEPAGYVMLIHAQNPAQWIIERLTIDGDKQRQGIGFAVADQLVDMVHDFENSEMVIARYKPDNEAARILFAKLGFEEREEMFRGRKLATLEFEFEEVEEDDDDEEAGDQVDRPYDDSRNEEDDDDEETGDQVDRPDDGLRRRADD